MNTYDVLKTIGCKKAYEFHLKGEGNGSYPLSDYYKEYLEEETVLYPILLKISDSLKKEESIKLKDSVMNLVNDHTEYRLNYLDKGIEPLIYLSQIHGAKEDILISKYEKEIIKLFNDFFKKKNVAKT